MKPYPTTRPTRRRPGLFAVAALAAVAGTLCAHAVTHACSCSTPQWSVHLVSVSTDEGAPSHEAHWPLEAKLTSNPETAILRSLGDEGAALDYVRGGTW